MPQPLHIWHNRRVTVMGLGRHGGGVGAARWLAKQGAVVTVTDLATSEALADSVKALSDVRVAQWRMGEHVEADFKFAEVVIVNPAVRPGNSFVELARRSGAAIASEIELFLQHCPASVVGVTGTNGKSTTCDMLAKMLRAGGRTAWLGGNFGGSLLDDLDRMTASDVVVLELSSFQLYYLSEETRWPLGAIVTNCTPNHLDWHGSIETYVAAKRRLVRHGGKGSWLAWNPFDHETSTWLVSGVRRNLFPWSHPRLPANVRHVRHIAFNAAQAASAATQLGVQESAIVAALQEYRGLPHRMQVVAQRGGRTFIDDSKATTPEATLAALDALRIEHRLWLLLGGQDKGCDFAKLMEVAGKYVEGAACFGECRDQLSGQFVTAAPTMPLFSTEAMPEALAWCMRHSRRGDTILLSPACASLDQYADFAARGEHFAKLVNSIEL